MPSKPPVLNPNVSLEKFENNAQYEEWRTWNKKRAHYALRTDSGEFKVIYVRKPPRTLMENVSHVYTYGAQVFMLSRRGSLIGSLLAHRNCMHLDMQSAEGSIELQAFLTLGIIEQCDIDEHNAYIVKERAAIRRHEEASTLRRLLNKFEISFDEKELLQKLGDPHDTRRSH